MSIELKGLKVKWGWKGNAVILAVVVGVGVKLLLG
jgi:hypothetical protein